MFKTIKKIEKFIKNNKYSLRSLVNLFFDLNASGNTSNVLSSELITRLKENYTLLTPFLVILILKAGSTNRINLKNHDFYLMEIAIRRYEMSPTEFDLNQKCIIFKSISKLDLNFVNEKKFFPQALISLNYELQTMLHNLAENNILNILSAFISLPANFNYDLLTNLHEVIISTLEENNLNINSHFLLKYLEVFNQIRKIKKWEVKKMEPLTKELANRLEFDVFLSKPTNIRKIIDLYFHVESDLILNKLKEKLLTLTKELENHLVIIEYLAFHRVNISMFLDEVHFSIKN